GSWRASLLTSLLAGLKQYALEEVAHLAHGAMAAGQRGLMPGVGQHVRMRVADDDGQADACEAGEIVYVVPDERGLVERDSILPNEGVELFPLVRHALHAADSELRASRRHD